MGELHQIMKTETVIGKPLQAGNMTIIPVSKISFGFAAGSGKRITVKVALAGVLQ